jgi:hypothetical protein
MRIVFSVIIGTVLFVYLVFMPLRASVVSALISLPGLDSKAKVELLEYASQFDPCFTPILEKAGDNFFLIKNHTMAAINYGKAMHCSPGNAAVRFKYGESLLAMGFIEGSLFVEESLRLEPHNPYYIAETKRLKELQQQLQ